MTVRDYLASSLRLLGVLAPGEALHEQDYTDALAAFSRMLNSWSAERLTIYSQNRSENALVNGTQRYTIGTGGTWTQARPLWIDGAGYLDASGLETPIEVISRTRWQNNSIKSDSGPRPEGIFYNPTYPLGAIDVWPVPNAEAATGEIVIYSPLAPLTSAASLDTAISVPEGWEEALIYNLAMRLAPTYGQAPAEDVRELARELKANIKRPNILADEMIIDPAITRGRGRWSISAGEFIGGD
jgi:hypothetical protein